MASIIFKKYAGIRFTTDSINSEVQKCIDIGISEVYILHNKIIEFDKINFGRI